MSVSPATLVAVVGTGTEVGKTWVSERLLRAWRAGGLTVAARKPAQSFSPGEGPTDADRLGAASGEDPLEVCPSHRWYPVPMAPPMAAAVLGRPAPVLAELVAELCWAPSGSGPGPGSGSGSGLGSGSGPGSGPGSGMGPGPNVGLVETAGGVRSPQADDGDAVDLLGALQPDRVVLVADAGLGTINGVRLAVEALTSGTTAAVVVVLNRFSPASDLHRRNRTWLTDRCGLDVVTSPAAVSEPVPPVVADLAGRLATPAPGRT